MSEQQDNSLQRLNNAFINPVRIIQGSSSTQDIPASAVPEQSALNAAERELEAINESGANATGATIISGMTGALTSIEESPFIKRLAGAGQLFDVVVDLSD